MFFVEKAFALLRFYAFAHRAAARDENEGSSPELGERILHCVQDDGDGTLPSPSDLWSDTLQAFGLPPSVGFADGIPRRGRLKSLYDPGRLPPPRELFYIVLL